MIFSHIKLIFLIFVFLIFFCTFYPARKLISDSPKKRIDERKKIGKRNEFPLVLLVSLPGSGNTWLRQLFEETTGYYTGSVYDDKSLFEGGLHGETLRYEDGQTPLVKTHSTSAQNLHLSKTQGLVFLVRNPYEATVSEWKRAKSKSHTGVPNEKVFRDGLWDTFARKNLQHWRHLVYEVVNFASKLEKKVHIIYYENLLKNSTSELEKLMRFYESEFNWKPEISIVEEFEGHFHREKQAKSVEYFSNELIEIGDYDIELIHDFMNLVGFPVFNKTEYLRGNSIVEKTKDEITKNKNVAEKYKAILTDTNSYQKNALEEKYYEDPTKLWRSECSPQDGVVFLRKHKSASTTLKAMTEKYLFSIGVESEPPIAGPLGGCFPAEFDERCWAGSKRNEPVQAMTFHFRWNMEYLPAVLNKNRRKVKIFTSIRDPLFVFRSSMNFFNREELVNSCQFACWEEPYRSLLGKSPKNATVGEVLESMLQKFNYDLPQFFRLSNMQSFELGLSYAKMNNRKYVAEKLIQLEKQFDLVILAEYFIEGVVLLKHMLCCEYVDLFVRNQNVKEYEKQALTAEQMKIFKDFHQADLQMYEFFEESMHRKIEAFGKEKFEKEKELALETFRKCEAKELDCSSTRKRFASSTEVIKTPNLSGSDFLSLVHENGGNCQNRFCYTSVVERSLRGEPANFEEANNSFQYKRCSQIMNLINDLEN